jgi:hypothetical protein
MDMAPDTLFWRYSQSNPGSFKKVLPEVPVRIASGSANLPHGETFSKLYRSKINFAKIWKEYPIGNIAKRVEE